MTADSGTPAAPAEVTGTPPEFWVATVTRWLPADEVRGLAVNSTYGIGHRWGNARSGAVWWHKGTRVHVTRWTGGNYGVFGEDNRVLVMTLAAAKHYLKSWRNPNGRRMASTVGPGLFERYQQEMSR